LSSLKEFDATNNKLTALPLEFSRLADTLKDLYIDSNPWIIPPPFIVRRGIFFIMKYIKSLAGGEQKCQNISLIYFI
jgi:hypothetical protein